MWLLLLQRPAEFELSSPADDIQWITSRKAQSQNKGQPLCFLHVHLFHPFDEGSARVKHFGAESEERRERINNLP